MLNAVRWDLDGDGDVDSSANEAAYRAAFAGSAALEYMGCLDGPDQDQQGDCGGYELAADLDFDTDDDGDVDADDPNSYANWLPIGGTYSAVFDGNGRTISNLTVVDAAGNAALFNAVSGAVRSLGLADVDVSGVGGNTNYVAPLAGELGGTAIASWASGRVRAGATGAPGTAGLVGRMWGSSARLAASYSTADVSGRGFAGGLVAAFGGGATIVAGYATGAVAGGLAGGLVGENVGSTVRASYFAGSVGGVGVGGYAAGVVASNDGSGENYHDVYFDAGSTGLASGARRRTTRALQAPTSATGTLYGNWDDLDVNGNGETDEAPWDFGTAHNHPVLRYGGLDPASQRNDYDADGDGLIEISTLAQLHAVRWDLDGDGSPISSATSSYFAASGTSTFANAVFNAAGAGLACRTTAADAEDNDCKGYELVDDLDFDTDGSGATWTETGGVVAGDANDAYDNGGLGWDPIGPAASPSAGADTHFNATFDGNGHVIENLFVNRTRNRAGLFAGTHEAARIVALGLPDARVAGGTHVGVVAGNLYGRIAGVWATGEVSGSTYVGGLAGSGDATAARIVASYSTVAVSCASSVQYSTGGGLVSYTIGQVAASYSTGEVTGDCPVKRGLLDAGSSGTVTASYWDTGLSGIAGNPPLGRSTAALQMPTSYDTPAGNAVYATWDDQDVDGDGTAGNGDDADPWSFGLSNQHPILKYRGLAAAPQLDAQPDLAPDFGTGMVSNKTFQNGRAIQAFQIPAATAGNGVLTYAESGLPTGLVFDADGTGSCVGNAPRTVCGTPTATTTAPVTVTITASDSDSNLGNTDQDTLTFTVAVVAPSAAITSPATLAEATLNGATVTVALTNAAFESGVTAAHFTLTTNLPGLRVSSLATVNAGDTSATLTLGHSGGFDTVRTLSVTVADAAHTLVGALTTPTVNIVPTPSVTVDPTSLALTEGSDGTYTVVLGGQPTGTVTVTAASTFPDVATVDADDVAPGLQSALSFTTGELERAADGDGVAGGRRHRGRRNRDRPPHGVELRRDRGKRQRDGGRRRDERHRDRHGSEHDRRGRRLGGAAGRRAARRPLGELHGEAGGAADRDDDGGDREHRHGRGDGGRHGPAGAGDAERAVVHDRELGHGADRHLAGGAGRRSEQRGGGDRPCGVERRLQRRDRAADGDGGGRRRGRDRGHGSGHDRRPADAAGAGGALVRLEQSEDVHGTPVDAAGGRQRDGGGGERQRRHRRRGGGVRGNLRQRGEPDVHGGELGHGADGAGTRRAGRGPGGRAGHDLERPERRPVRQGHDDRHRRHRAGRRDDGHGLRRGRRRPDRGGDARAPERDALGPGRRRLEHQRDGLPRRFRRFRAGGGHGLPGRPGLERRRRLRRLRARPRHRLRHRPGRRRGRGRRHRQLGAHRHVQRSLRHGAQGQRPRRLEPARGPPRPVAPGLLRPHQSKLPRRIAGAARRLRARGRLGRHSGGRPARRDQRRVDQRRRRGRQRRGRRGRPAARHAEGQPFHRLGHAIRGRRRRSGGQERRVRRRRAGARPHRRQLFHGRRRRPRRRRPGGRQRPCVVDRCRELLGHAGQRAGDERRRHGRDHRGRCRRRLRRPAPTPTGTTSIWTATAKGRRRGTSARRTTIRRCSTAAWPRPNSATTTTPTATG